MSRGAADDHADDPRPIATKPSPEAGRPIATAPGPAAGRPIATKPGPAAGRPIACVGKVVTDEVILCEEQPRPDAHQNVTRLTTAGGAAANVAANLAAHGHPARLCGWAGADEQAGATVAGLAHPLLSVQVVRRGRGPVATVLAWGGDRSFLVDQGTMRPAPDGVDAGWVAGAGALHLNGFELLSYGWPALLADLARLARTAGTRVTLDTPSARRLRSDGVSRFLAALAAVAPDVVFCNAAEAAALGWTEESLAAGAGAAQPPMVVVHAGTDPTTVHTGGALLRVAVDDVVAEAETTGCGDAFAAGFLSVWANSPAAADGQLPPRNLAAPSGAGEPRDLAERAGADELGDLAAPSGADELRDPADRADPAAPTDPAAPLEPAAENHRALLDAVRTGHAWAAEIARRPGAQPALR